MYFEPDKKAYYRFPSANSVQKLDKRMYLPEKPTHAIDNSYDNHNTSYSTDKEDVYDFK